MRLSERLTELELEANRLTAAKPAHCDYYHGQDTAFGEAAALAETFESTLLTQLVTIHRDLATARRNANLPPQLNTLGTDLQSVHARLEALVTSLGGGVYLEGEGWRR